MVNKVILLGHVGKDPEVRRMDNNMTMARFSLATKEYRNKDGVRTEHTEWHYIVLWGKLAELAEKYVRKGSLLYVEGRLRSRTWDDKDGNKRYTTEIFGDTMNFVGPRPDGQSGTSAQAGAQAVPEAPIPPIETTDIGSAPDDLPF